MEKEQLGTSSGQGGFREKLLSDVFDRITEGKLVEAAKILEELHRDLRKDDDIKERRFVMLQAAKVQLMLGKYARARSFVEAVRELFPEDEEVEALSGKIYMGEYQFDTAITHFQRLPETHPDKYIGLCTIAIKERQLVQAQQYLVKAHQYVSAELPEYVLLWAYVRLLEGHEKEALTSVRELMKDPPMDTGLLLLAAEIYMTSGTYGEAKKVTKLVNQYAPQHDHAFAVRSFALYAEEDYDLAEKEAYKALDFNKANAYARTVLMKCATRRGDYQFAESLGLAILRESPGYSLAHANLGDVYFNEGSYERAEVEYNKSKHLMDSLTKGAKLRRARMEYMKNNVKAAVSILLTLIGSSHSYYDDAMCDLWLCYERLGMDTERDAILDKMELRRAFYHRTEKIMEELSGRK